MLYTGLVLIHNLYFLAKTNFITPHILVTQIV